jgi:hypothetical protein
LLLLALSHRLLRSCRTHQLAAASHHAKLVLVIRSSCSILLVVLVQQTPLDAVFCPKRLRLACVVEACGTARLGTSRILGAPDFFKHVFIVFVVAFFAAVQDAAVGQGQHGAFASARSMAHAQVGGDGGSFSAFVHGGVSILVLVSPRALVVVALLRRSIERLPLLLRGAALLLLARAPHPSRHAAAVVFFLVIIGRPKRLGHGGLLCTALARLCDARAQGVGGGLLLLLLGLRGGGGGGVVGSDVAAACCRCCSWCRRCRARLERLEPEGRAEPV